jgi:hypothetical protein
MTLEPRPRGASVRRASNRVGLASPSVEVWQFDSEAEPLYTRLIPHLGITHRSCGYGIDDACIESMMPASIGVSTFAWTVEILERTARGKELVHA